MQAILEKNNFEMLQVKFYNQMDSVHPVVDKEGEEGRAVSVVTKFRAL